MENRSSCNLFPGYHITAAFCTCYNSTTVVFCKKNCGDNSIKISARAKLNFHQIWILWEKSLVKWATEGYQNFLTWSSHSCWCHGDARGQGINYLLGIRIISFTMQTFHYHVVLKALDRHWTVKHTLARIAFRYKHDKQPYHHQDISLSPQLLFEGCHSDRFLFGCICVCCHF